MSAQFAPARAVVFPHAITYDSALVPPGAEISVSQRTYRHGMDIRVALRRARPGHTFGVHVHTKPCAADPDAAGPHYQHRKDPMQPSTDPAYANPRNEVWLDMHTDDRGDARRSVHHDRRFREGEARSVVLHEHATATAPGHAGRAGDRVACFTVPFADGDGS